MLGDPTPGGVATECCGDHPWTKVYDLGTYKQPGDSGATPSADRSGEPACRRSTPRRRDLRRVLRPLRHPQRARRRSTAASRRTSAATSRPSGSSRDGWHIAAAEGLPERFITSVAIDPADATKRTIYVTLGGYSRRWVPPGTLGDPNPTSARATCSSRRTRGQSFTDVSGNLPDVPATWVTLRGKQLIVGTDVGVFATNPKGKPTYSYLDGLPVVPISTMNLKPDDPNLLVVATYGRGIWTYCFDQPVPGHDRRLPDHAAAAAGEADRRRWARRSAGPFGFELGAEGWTTTTQRRSPA